MRYFSRNAYIALALGIFSACVFALIAFLIISGKQKKQKTVTGNRREREMLKTHLALLSKPEAAKLISVCLDGNAKVERYRITADDRIYYPMFSFEPTDRSRIASVIKRSSAKKKTVLCNGICDEAAALAKQFGIDVMLTDELFDRLKKGNALPEKYLCSEAASDGAWKKIKSRFNRRLTLPLFLSGFALTAMSYLTLFPVYYIVSGAALIILASIALFIS